MGKLTRRPGSPYWQARWTASDGTPRRKSTGTADRRVATLRLATWESAEIRAEAAGLRSIGLVDALGIYLEQHQPPVWSKGWYRTSYLWWRSRIIPALGADTPLHEVTRDDVLSARARWLREVQPPTVNRISAVASGLWHWACHEERRYALRNPWSDLPRFEEPRAEPPPLTVAQLEAWLTAIPNPVIRRMAIIRLDTSKRPGEIRAMRMRDVNLAAGAVRVVAAKSGREHWVPLSARSLRAIREQAQEAGDELFARAPSNVRKSLDAAHRASGVPRFRWYDLRHYALTDLADHGAMPHDLAEAAGWNSPQQAARYVHASAERVRVIQQRREATRAGGASDRATSAPAQGEDQGVSGTQVHPDGAAPETKVPTFH